MAVYIYLKVIWIAIFTDSSKLEIANSCAPPTKEFGDTSYVFASKGTSLTLLCKIWRPVVYWYYLGAENLLPENGYIESSDGNVIFSHVSGDGLSSCLISKAIIGNISSVVDEPITCKDDDNNPSTSNSVVISHTGKCGNILHIISTKGNSSVSISHIGLVKHYRVR